MASYVKFLRGTPEAYNAAIKESDTLYFVYREENDYGELYIGARRIVSGIGEDELISTLAGLKDVDVSNVIDGQVLGWDQKANTWKPMTLPEAKEVSVMLPASENEDGAAGLVPAPKAGDQAKFLRGDGNWIEGYSKTEIDDIISGLNSLSRKKVNSKEDIDVNAADADKYIYIVSTGEEGQEGNQYFEYIVIEGKVEQIGSIGTGTGEVNIINSVNDSEFEISNDENKTLSLKSVPVNKIVDFETHESIIELQTSVGTLQADFISLQSDVEVIKQNLAWGSID